MKIRVIGVGTHHGDDVAGILVAESLARADLPPEVEVRTCRLPGLALLDALDGASAVVLVDATRSGRPPGSVHRPDPRALLGTDRWSSHALGVREVLSLAEALGRLPGQVELVGIEGGATESPDSPDSPDVGEAVRRAVPEACECVLAVVRSLCAQRAGSPEPGVDPTSGGDGDPRRRLRPRPHEGVS